MRTQQVIAHETGIVNTADPLGGSFFLEALTKEMEEAAYRYFQRIDALGGVVSAIDKGFYHREIADAAFHYQREIENRERIIVGVNDYVSGQSAAIPTLKIDGDGERRHLERLNRVRRERDSQAVSEKLNLLREAAHSNQNLMPFILDAVRAYATLGEICGVLRQEFGEYEASSGI